MGTIYCDIVNGSDATGIGSSGNPYATLGKAFTVVAPGDVIKIANTGAQSFASLAYPAIATSLDAWMLIEGWDNGGAEEIENPSSNFADIGVIEGMITGTLAFVKWKKIRFQNVNVVNARVVAQNNDTIYEQCDWNNITYNFGQAIAIGARNIVRFCSIRNTTGPASQSAIIFGSNQSRVMNCYFYNMPNAITMANQTYNSVQDCVIDKVTGYGIRIDQADGIILTGNTIVGDNSTANARGISLTNLNMEAVQIYNNHIQDFSGVGAVGISAAGLVFPTTKGTFDIIGNNSFYNNTANYDKGTNFAETCMSDLTGDDIQEVAEPLVDKAAFNYAKKSTALSYGQTGIPKGMNYTTTETNKTIGAVDNTLSAGGDTESFYAGI